MSTSSQTGATTVTSGSTGLEALLGSLYSRQEEASQNLLACTNSSQPEGASPSGGTYGVVGQVTFTHEGVTPFVTSLLRIGPNETAAGWIRVSESSYTVEVPTALFTSPARPDYLVLSVAELQPGDETIELINASTEASGDVLATPPLSIQLYSWEHEINGTLAAPIQFTVLIPNTSDAKSLECMYWEEALQLWSSKGIATSFRTENAIECSTTHLSIFALLVSKIWSAIVCSNAAGIFSLQGLQSLLKWQWAVRAPAIVQWSTLFIGICLLCAARRLDRKYLERMDVLEGFQRIKMLRSDGSSRRDFVADLKEHVMGVFHPSKRVASQLLKRKMGLGVGELHQLQRVSGVTGWHLQARLALSHFTEQRLVSKLAMLYQVHCRWFSFITPSLKASCVQRCLVLFGKLYSGWAVMSIFYGSTALAPDQPDCYVPSPLLDKIIRSAFIAWISAMLGAMPLVALLAMVHLGGRTHQGLWTRFFWGYMTLHMVFCIMVVSIFLASTSPSDGERFLISSLTNVLTSLLVQPVLLTLLFGICLLPRSGALDDLVDWKREDKFEVEVANVSIPLEQLKASLLLDSHVAVTLATEVFGDPSSAITLRKEADGSFCSDESLFLARGQVLMFSVMIIEMRRRSVHTLHAVVLGSDVAAGFNSSLPLYVAGKKSPCAEVQLKLEMPTAMSKEAKLSTKMEECNKEPHTTAEAIAIEVALPSPEGSKSQEKGPPHDEADAACMEPLEDREPKREIPLQTPAPGVLVPAREPAPEPELPELNPPKHPEGRRQEAPAAPEIFAQAPTRPRSRMGPCLQPQVRVVGGRRF